MKKYFNETELKGVYKNLVEVEATTTRGKKLAILMEVNDDKAILRDAKKGDYLNEETTQKEDEILEKHINELFKKVRLHMVTTDKTGLYNFGRVQRFEELKEKQPIIYYQSEWKKMYHYEYKFYTVNEKGEIDNITYALKDFTAGYCRENDLQRHFKNVREM